MGNKRRTATRLIALWLASDAKCHWCGNPTVLFVVPPKSPARVRRHGAQFPDRATIDHLDSKLSSERKQRNDQRPRTVLACYECNQSCCREEQAALPKEELRRLSGRHPIHKVG